MTYPDILAALAREEIDTVLSEAQTARQASLARSAARGKRVVPHNGPKRLIRLARSGGEPPLAGGFTQCHAAAESQDTHLKESA